jgi:hypothetical protein
MAFEPISAAQLPLPPLPQPAQPEHVVLRFGDKARQLRILCWCDMSEELNS